MLITQNLSFMPYDLKWFPCSARVCVVGSTKEGTGRIAIYQLSKKELVLKGEMNSVTPIRCVAITGHERHIVTGDFEGVIQTWDPQQLAIPITSVKGHEGIVNCLDSLNCEGEPAEIATVSRDGSIKVWDMRQPTKAVMTISSKNNTRDIWAIAFGWVRGNKVIAVGYEDGVVQLFDVDGSQYVWEAKVKSGICSVDFDEEGNLLVSTVIGVCVIDIESGKINHVKSAKETTMWRVKQLPGTKCFTVAGGDGTLSTYNSNKLTDPEHVLQLSKHPITSLDWNEDKMGLFACCSFDKTIKIGLIQQ
ncbi:unnamed protein product [Rhizopus stolonifer]